MYIIYVCHYFSAEIKLSVMKSSYKTEIVARASRKLQKNAVRCERQNRVLDNHFGEYDYGTISNVLDCFSKLQGSISRFHLLSSIYEVFSSCPNVVQSLIDGNYNFMGILINVLMDQNEGDNEIIYKIFSKVKNVNCKQMLLLKDYLFDVVRELNNKNVSNIATSIMIILLYDDENGVDIANSLIYEENYLDFVEQMIKLQSSNVENIFHVLSIIFKKCDENLILKNEMKIIPLLQTIFFLNLGNSYKYSLKCFRRLITFTSKQMVVIITPAMLKYITSIEPIHYTFLFLNDLLYYNNMIFSDSLYIIDWIFPKRKISELMILIYRFIGNLSYVPEYCNYIFVKKYHELILLDHDQLIFQIMDDFYIFFCRITSFETISLVSNPLFNVIFDKLIDYIESTPSDIFSLSFLKMIYNISEKANDTFIKIISKYSEINEILISYSNSSNDSIKIMSLEIMKILNLEK